MKRYFENKNTAAIIALFAMILWGSAIPMIKTSYEILNISQSDMGSKIYIAGLRFLGAAILVFIYKILFDREKKKRVNLKLCILLAVVQVVGQYLFYYIGLSNTQGVKAAIIQSTNPLIVVLLAHFMLGDDRINKKKLIAIVMGIMAIYISNRNKSASIDYSFKISGEGFILLASCFNALGTIFTRKYAKDQNSYILNIFQFGLGSVILLIIGSLFKQADLVFTPKATILLLYGSFISATAYLLWFMVLKYQKAGIIGMFKLFVPIFGSAMAVVFLGESYSVDLFIALILTTFATVFLNSRLMED